MQSAVTLSGALGASALASEQRGFSYGPAITTDEKLSLPQGRKINVAFTVGEGVQVIDLAGPWEVFQDVRVENRNAGSAREAPFQLYTVAENKQPVEATGGLLIVPNFTVDDAPAPDIVIVPYFKSSGMTRIHDWMKATFPQTILTLTICAGAFEFAKTGLLDGVPATTNARAYDQFQAAYPKVDLRRGPRFVEAGKIATAGGLTAGIDLALRVVDRCFGNAVAQETADFMEYVGDGWRVRL